jgi:hypothetical protein
MSFWNLLAYDSRTHNTNADLLVLQVDEVWGPEEVAWKESGRGGLIENTIGSGVCGCVCMCGGTIGCMLLNCGDFIIGATV